MKFNDLPLLPKPNKIVVADTSGDTRAPYERVKAYNCDEYELFIREWVTSLEDKYQVRGFGGSGDKGRDVVAKDSLGNFYYYQCKHYNHPLNPSDILPEFGKLVYYTFKGDIAIPKEYYIMAPFDISPSLNDLIENPQKINTELIEKWDSSCKKKISAKEIALTIDLKQYITDFDFSIIKTKSMLEVVEEHKKTAFYAFRFGGGLTIKRNRDLAVPDKLSEIENVYVSKFLEAVSEYKGQTITTVEQLSENFPKYAHALKIHRERFYSAENLKIFASRHLLSDEYFNDLCNDIFHGIYDYFVRDYSCGMERLNDVMSNVVQIDLKHNLLYKYDLVHPQDRQGICHQLANEKEEISWTIKD